MIKAFATLSLASALAVAGCSNRHEATPAGKAVENTEINERDRSGQTLTPGDQNESEGDLKATQELRQAIVGDDSLSFDAKNIKIITRGSVITLRGPVKSEAERQAIEARARRVNGIASVNNELEVSQPQ